MGFTMDTKRYFEIELKGASLTQEEKEDGWHFCPDWDGLLTGPEMDEIEHCLCNK